MNLCSDKIFNGKGEGMMGKKEKKAADTPAAVKKRKISGMGFCDRHLGTSSPHRQAPCRCRIRTPSCSCRWRQGRRAG